jgi:TonB family protein
MFGESLSSRRAPSPCWLLSIMIHALIVAACWQPRVMKRVIPGIQVVHASSVRTVWLPRESTAVLPHKNAGEPRIENFIPPVIPVPPTEEQSLPGSETAVGTETIPSDINALLDLGFASELSEQTLQSHLKDIARLDIQQSDVPVAPPPEFDNKPAESVADDRQNGGGIQPARLLKKTIPTYPQVAKTARIQGVVLLEATITESGRLEDVTVISGHPMLIDAAVDAIRHWRYEPAKSNGIPMRSSVNIRVNFVLQFH